MLLAVLLLETLALKAQEDCPLNQPLPPFRQKYMFFLVTLQIFESPNCFA